MNSIRWGWVLLGGLVAEVLIFAVAISIAIFVGEGSVLYTAPTASLIATFVCGWWVAKKATDHRMLHGILVSAAAIVIYVAMSLGRPEPLAYVISHALKVVGGAVGGYLSLGRMRSDSMTSPLRPGR